MLTSVVVRAQTNNISTGTLKNRWAIIDEKNFGDTIPDLKVKELSLTEKIYDYAEVEQQPEFPGGIAKFLAYFFKNFKYPYSEGDEVIGTLAYSFVVEKNGSLSNIKPTMKLPKKIFDEVLKVLNNSPKWQPGLVNNKVVKVEYRLRMCILLRE